MQEGKRWNILCDTEQDKEERDEGEKKEPEAEKCGTAGVNVKWQWRVFNRLCALGAEQSRLCSFFTQVEEEWRKIDPFAAHDNFMFSEALKNSQEESALPNFKSAQTKKHSKCSHQAAILWQKNNS